MPSRRPGSGHRQPRVPTPAYFVGDSITYGFTATTLTHTYRAQLETYLRQGQAARVVESGVWSPGWRAADALKAVIAHPPAADTRLLVVEIGTNNAAHTHDPAAFDAQYRQIIGRLQAAAPGARLVCLSAWWQPGASQPYNAAIQRACASGMYVNITTLYANPAYRGPAGRKTFLWQRTDDFHPNDAGHAAIALAVATRVFGGQP